jgi:hypothetical protein
VLLAYPCAVGGGHGAVQLDEQVAGLDLVAILDVDGLDDAAFQRLYGLAALADHDAALRHGHDVDLPEAGPQQRDREERADGDDGAAWRRVRRCFLQ